MSDRPLSHAFFCSHFVFLLTIFSFFSLSIPTFADQEASWEELAGYEVEFGPEEYGAQRERHIVALPSIAGAGEREFVLRIVNGDGIAAEMRECDQSSWIKRLYCKLRQRYYSWKNERGNASLISVKLNGESVYRNPRFHKVQTFVDVPIELAEENEIQLRVRGRRSSSVQIILFGEDDGSVNLPPVASIQINPSSGMVPLTVQLDGSGSTDDKDQIAEYRWNFGDGSGEAIGEQVSHVFATPGSFTVTLTVTDDEGLSGQAQVNVIVEPDTTAPALAISSPQEGDEITQRSVLVEGSVDEPVSQIRINGNLAEIDPDQVSFSYSLSAAVDGPLQVSVEATDLAGNVGTAEVMVSINASTDPEPIVPPAPETVAPPISEIEVVPLARAVEFLYSGDNPIQTGVAVEQMEEHRAAVLRGQVMDDSGVGIPGVVVTIKNHPQFGQTVTQADGRYDMVVNGGGDLVLEFAKNAYIATMRRVRDVAWVNYTSVDDVVMIPLDPVVTNVDFSGASSVVQVARSSQVTDEDGTRSAAIVIPAETTAEMVMPDGSKQSVGSLSIRSTEYTVGEMGLEKMPLELPRGTMYTWAAELSADEAIAAGARSIEFSQPVPIYLENFIDMPVGALIPVGFINEEKATWEPSENGKVIGIVGVNNGEAEIDLTGNGQSQTNQELDSFGIDAAERRTIASLYQSGQSVWRMPVSNFSTIDGNMPGDIGMEPPDDPEPPDDDEDDDDGCGDVDGSVIGVRYQTLGEEMSIVGAPFSLNYWSFRSDGRVRDRKIEIEVIGPIVPVNLASAKIEITVAGQKVTRKFPAQGNQTFEMEWDGKDAYGRKINGEVTVFAKTTYSYAFEYSSCREAPSPLFGYKCEPVTDLATLQRTGPRAIATIDVASESQFLIGSQPVDYSGLGLWNPSIHHYYDPANNRIYKGDGSGENIDLYGFISDTVAGDGQFAAAVEGPALETPIAHPAGLAFAPDGTLYFGEEQAHRVWKLNEDGNIEVVAGTGERGYSGDGGPATEATFDFVSRIDIASDGSIYVVDYNNHAIRKIDTDGIIRTVAGTGTAGYNGDNIPATEAQLTFPEVARVAPDGTLYIGDEGSSRFRAVGTDGIIRTVAGNGVYGDPEFGVDARTQPLTSLTDILFNDDGSILVSTTNTVMELGKAGEWRLIAGVPNRFWQPGDEENVPFLEATFFGLEGIAKDSRGKIYVNDHGPVKIRMLDLDGLVKTVIGDGNDAFGADGIPGTLSSITFPRDLKVGPDDLVYFSDNGGSNRIRVVRPSGRLNFGIIPGQVIYPDPGGEELYVFEQATGKHLETRHAANNKLKYSFSYDSDDFLVEIVDGYGKVTRIERDSGGEATAIVSHFNQQTILSVDDRSHLVSVRNPAGSTYELQYTPLGLLRSMEKPTAEVSIFDYDEVGNLIRDTNALGGFIELVLGEEGQRVDAVTAEGIIQSSEVTGNVQDQLNRNFATAGGVSRSTQFTPDGREVTSWSNGTVVSVRRGADPRYGVSAPFVSEERSERDGQIKVTNATRTVVPEDFQSLDDIELLREVTVVNGRAPVSASFNPQTGAYEEVSAEGRVLRLVLDDQLRVLSHSIDGVLSTSLIYDTLGRLVEASQGSRVSKNFYNGNGKLESTLDAAGRTNQYFYDNANFLVREVLPDGSEIAYQRDEMGRLEAVTPPGQPTHFLDRNEVGKVTTYLAPETLSGAGSDITSYSYDLDMRLSGIERPDGSSLSYTYDAYNRLSEIVASTGENKSFTTDPRTGETTEAIGATGVRGALVRESDFLIQSSVLFESGSNEWSVTVESNYNSEHLLNEEFIRNGFSFEYVYDQDENLVQLGEMSFTYNSVNNYLLRKELGGVVEDLTYNSYGELTGITVGSYFSDSNVRDELGRIIEKTTVIGGNSSTISYGYDLAGNLHSVVLDSGSSVEYLYDQNGNRTSKIKAGVIEAATFDSQDRMLSQGSLIFDYNENGEMIRKTNVSTNETTDYAYDVYGQLKRVGLPDGTVVEYEMDGFDRRVIRKVNGVITQSFGYRDEIKLVSVHDGLSLEPKIQFAYGTKSNVPEYMFADGELYKIVSDHLGSVRQIIDVASGVVVQQIDYDEWGMVLNDTNPGFQPFGFAGGIYDSSTGLVKFGARSYMPKIGRWMSKDPILFEGEDTNLYRYVKNDPLNLIDENGLYPDSIDEVGECIWGNLKTISESRRRNIERNQKEIASIRALIASLKSSPLCVDTSAMESRIRLLQVVNAGYQNEIDAIYAKCGSFLF